MKISNYTNNTYFGTSYRKVYKSDEPYLIDHENSTSTYKNDFQWNKGFDFFIEKYKNTDKVNVYSLGCSDCSEALSIAMILDTKLKEKSNKYFPIIAVDNDEGILSNIKKGYIDLSAEDEKKINHYTNNNLNKYLKRTQYTYISDRKGSTDIREKLTRYKINPNLLNKIKIVNEDVVDYTDKMSDKNNLIFARNFWIYLKIKNKEEEFLSKLSKKSDKNSFLVIGNYDMFMCPLTIKNSNGFSMHPNLNNVFDKSGSDYFDDMRLIKRGSFKDY